MAFSGPTPKSGPIPDAPPAGEAKPAAAGSSTGKPAGLYTFGSGRPLPEFNQPKFNFNFTGFEFTSKPAAASTAAPKFTFAKCTLAPAADPSELPPGAADLGSLMVIHREQTRKTEATAAELKAKEAAGENWRGLAAADMSARAVAAAAAAGQIQRSWLRRVGLIRAAAAGRIQRAIRSPAFRVLVASRAVAATTIQAAQRRRVAFHGAIVRNLAALGERKAAFEIQQAARDKLAVADKADSELVKHVKWLLDSRDRAKRSAPAPKPTASGFGMFAPKSGGGFGGLAFGAKPTAASLFGSSASSAAQNKAAENEAANKVTLDALASLVHDMDGTVGLDAVRSHALQMLEDCLGRDLSGERAGWSPTMIVITGGMGTGKKHAQDILQRMLSVGSAGTTAVKIMSKSKLVLLLDEREHIIRPPVVLKLPPPSPECLSMLTLRALRLRGYQLVAEPGTLPAKYPRTAEGAMSFVCEQLVSAADLKRRGVHAAGALVEQAISNKNARLSSKAVLSDRSALTPSDFGAALTSKAEKLRQQAAVDAEIELMTGFEPAKEMFQDIREKVAYVEAGGDCRVLETCLNLVVVGNPGTGKTSFARLLFRFLRAYGVLNKDTFVEMVRRPPRSIFSPCRLAPASSAAAASL